jgi:hypothetical protein
LGEWQSVPNLAQDIELPASDLNSLEAFAQQSGVSVALLMSSVMHQFISSRQDY